MEGSGCASQRHSPRQASHPAPCGAERRGSAPPFSHALPISQVSLACARLSVDAGDISELHRGLAPLVAGGACASRVRRMWPPERRDEAAPPQPPHWPRATGRLLLAAGHCTDCLLLAAYYWPSAVGGVLLATDDSPPTSVPLLSCYRQPVPGRRPMAADGRPPTTGPRALGPVQGTEALRRRVA